jgi:wyosine [tRNA(Phe)-imidazoG37] synthetase (radical SAM superfamily)
MELKDFQAITTQIAQNLTNQALVTELLTKLNDDYSQETTTKTSLIEQTNKFQDDIKQLQQTNMNLFLKVAQPTPDTTINTPEKLTYDKLFDENGGLK